MVGYGGKTINTLRLWAAAAPDYFDFQEFSSGDFVGALAGDARGRIAHPRALSRRFHQPGPGAALRAGVFPGRLLAGRPRPALPAQQSDWSTLPDKVAIQLNDTHPALAVPELMRILLDEARLGWDEAWDLTQRTLAYTNHTLLPEALEKWPVAWFEMLLPRHLEIIYEINRRFLDEVRATFPGDDGPRRSASSLIEEGAERKVRMANLAIVGSHSTNGVAAIHSEPAAHDDGQGSGRDVSRAVQQQDQRRHAAALAAAGQPGARQLDHRGHRRRLDHRPRPDCASCSRWPTTPASATPFARPSARPRCGSPTGSRPTPAESSIPIPSSTARSSASTNTSGNCSTRCASSCSTTGCATNPEPRRCRRGRSSSPARPRRPTTWPSSSSSSSTTWPARSTPIRSMRGRLKVVFLPEYNVTLAERLIPASDVSNQISTAGYEASGTSNMKFMMNGALTVGTRDGATIEMAEEAGEENFFLFGLTAEQVADSRGWYNPHWHYEHEPETRAALDLIFSGPFQPRRAGHLRPAARHAADARRPLHAPGRPDSPISRRTEQLGDAVRRPRRLGAQGDPERGRLRQVLQRPHHRPIRSRNLEGEALPDTIVRRGRNGIVTPRRQAGPDGDVGRPRPAGAAVRACPVGRIRRTRRSASAGIVAHRCAALSITQTIVCHERTDEERKVRCCVRDEGWSLEAGRRGRLQTTASCCRKERWW